MVKISLSYSNFRLAKTDSPGYDTRGSKTFFQQTKFRQTRQWRLIYAAGVVLGALFWRFALADGQAQHTSVPVWQLLVGGFLVGYGARLGNGCTSGHGICGLGALQWPSLARWLAWWG